MDEFLNQIKEGMLMYQVIFDDLITKAEEHGFYPTQELDLLKEDKKTLARDYDSEGADKPAIWERLCNICEVLKNAQGTEMADDLWKILEAIENFNFKYYPN